MKKPSIEIEYDAYEITLNGSELAHQLDVLLAGLQYLQRNPSPEQRDEMLMHLSRQVAREYERVNKLVEASREKAKVREAEHQSAPKYIDRLAEKRRAQQEYAVALWRSRIGGR